MGDFDDPGKLGDRWILIRARRHFKVLRYVVRTYDDLGSKLAAEPSTYEALLTLKRIKGVLGRYGPTEGTLTELVSLGYLEKKQGGSAKTIYLPTPAGREYLARLRFHLDGLTKEIRSFSDKPE